MGPEARTFYEAWYMEYRMDIIKRINAKFAGYYGRKSETVLKLAIVASVAESSTLDVTKKHISQAIGWLKLIEDSMMDAFNSTGKKALSEYIRKVWEMIKTSNEVTLHMVMQRFWQDVNGRDMSTIMADLEQMGAIIKIVRGTGETVYRIKPDGPTL